MAAACASATVAPPEATDAGAKDTGTFGRPREPSADAEDISCTPADAAGVEVPPPFAGRTSPVAADGRAIEAGRTIFGTRCATCHGSDGRGVGPAGPADPPAADFTSQRRSDDHLFWRISEGGRKPPFCSAMPAFDFLSETSRWQIVAFIQATFAPTTGGGGGDGGGG